MHTYEEIQRMFEAFELGSDAERERYVALAALGQPSAPRDGKTYFLRCNNETNVQLTEDGGLHAELA